MQTFVIVSDSLSNSLQQFFGVEALRVFLLTFFSFLLLQNTLGGNFHFFFWSTHFKIYDGNFQQLNEPKKINTKLASPL